MCVKHKEDRDEAQGLGFEFILLTCPAFQVTGGFKD